MRCCTNSRAAASATSRAAVSATSHVTFSVSIACQLPRFRQCAGFLYWRVVEPAPEAVSPSCCQKKRMVLAWCKMVHTCSALIPAKKNAPSPLSAWASPTRTRCFLPPCLRCPFLMFPWVPRRFRIWVQDLEAFASSSKIRALDSRSFPRNSLLSARSAATCASASSCTADARMLSENVCSRVQHSVNDAAGISPLGKPMIASSVQPHQAVIGSQEEPPVWTIAGIISNEFAGDIGVSHVRLSSFYRVANLKK